MSLTDNTREKFVTSDSGAGNGAAGGEKAHGNFIACFMETAEKSAGSAWKTQVSELGASIEDQLNRVVGNPLKDRQKVAELNHPKEAAADSVDRAALGWTFSKEANRAAGAGANEALVFDNSIYTENAKNGADKFIANAASGTPSDADAWNYSDSKRKAA